MGTGVDMIEQHYGHMLAAHANRSRDILDAIWAGFGRKLDATTNGTHRRRTPDSGSTKPFPAKPSNGLEPLTPSLPWKCSTN